MMSLNFEKNQQNDLDQIRGKLASTDSDERRWAVYELAQFDTSASIDALVQAIQDQSRAVREAAAEILEGCVPELAGGRLTPLLGHTRIEVRNCVASVLVKYGQSVIQDLIQGLGDSNEDIRKCSADILGLTRNPRAIAALCRVAVEEKVRTVSISAVEALGKIGQPQALPTLYEIIEGKPAMRPEAVEALGLIGDSAAASYLLDRLEQEDPLTTYAIIDALGNIGDDSALEPLTLFLATAPDYQRESIILSILKIGEQNEREVMDMADPHFRNGIFESLSANNSDLVSLVLKQIARGLSATGLTGFFQRITDLPSKIIVGLIHLAKSSHSDPQQLLALVEHPDDWVSYSAIEACQNLDADLLRPVLQEVLEQREGIPVLAALSVIESQNLRAFHPQLMKLKDSRQEDNRNEAARILVAWNSHPEEIGP